MSVGVLVTARDNHGTLAHVLAEIPEDLHRGVIVVDDGSDPPLATPGLMLARHDRPRGRGAALKTGMALALEAGVERLVTLRADHRCDTAAALALADALEHAEGVARGLPGADLALGRAPGPISRVDRALAAVANRRLHASLSVYHGVTISYRADALRFVHLERLPDDDGFELALVASLLARGFRAAEGVVPTRGPAHGDRGPLETARLLTEALRVLAWPLG